MKLSAILEPLVAAGVDAPTILAAVKAWEAQQTDALERRRANDRERQERRRHVTSRDVTVTVSSRGGVPRVEDKTSSSEIEPQEKKDTPRAALEAVLDHAHADAVIDHRQRIRKPLTPHAAKLLAGKFAQCADPNAAADQMISNGWQGFEPEWLTNRTTRAGPQPGRSGGLGSMFGQMREHLENGQGNGSSGGSSSGAPVLSLPHRRTG